MKRTSQIKAGWRVVFFGISLLCGTAPGWVGAADLYVSLNGANSGLRNSWSTAYTNIQDALSAAANGDTLYLAGQTFGVVSQLVWSAKTNVTLRGGYAATNDAGLPGEYDAKKWPTILTRASTNQTRLLMITNVAEALLERVTVSGGYQTLLSSGFGGGVYIVSAAGLVLSECVFNNNTVVGNNSSVYGGAIYVKSSTLTVSNCQIRGNTATTSLNWPSPYGGGLCAVGSAVTLCDSVVANNKCNGSNNTRLGGGIYQSGGLCILRNCLVAGNFSQAGSGDGICVAGSATTRVENCTVAYNGGQGINRTAGLVSVTNSIIWGNGDDVVGTMTLGTANIEDGDGVGSAGGMSADPRFERGFYLAPDSPCVGAGGATAAELGLAGKTTRVDGDADTGAVDLGYHYDDGLDFNGLDVYVATDGSDSANGGTGWVDAYQTIGKALGTIRDGGRIHVGPGSYGGESFPLRMDDLIGVWLVGSNAATTVINAAGSTNRALTVTGCDNVMISGLTLTGGYQYQTASPYGGGIAVLTCGGVTLADCVISSNTVVGNNFSIYGGGVYANASVLMLNRCRIQGNVATASSHYPSPYGGGVACLNGILAVNESIISTNRCSGSSGGRFGGGLYLSGVNGAFRNGLVIGNTTAAGTGGGLYVVGTSAVGMENCTVAFNAGQGINRGGGTVAVTNSILWGNGDDVVGAVSLGYSNIEDGDSNGVNGCISADPQFLDVAAMNYRLPKTSPCVHAGLNQSWMIEAVDLDGVPRIGGQRVDMGAYEHIVPLKGPVYRIR